MRRPPQVRSVRARTLMRERSSKLRRSLRPGRRVRLDDDYVLHSFVIMERAADEVVTGLAEDNRHRFTGTDGAARVTLLQRAAGGLLRKRRIRGELCRGTLDLLDDVK